MSRAGLIDAPSGEVTLGSSDGAGPDDVLDDCAELVLARGGRVCVVPAEQMPSDSGPAATYCF